MSDMRAGIMTLEELGEPGIVRIITAEPGNDGFSQEDWTAYTDAVFLGQIRPVLNAEIEEFVLPEEVRHQRPLWPARFYYDLPAP